MLLAMDVGNSNIKFGLFDGELLKASWRVGSDSKKTADEYGVILTDLFKSKNLKLSEVDGAILSSVIPSLNYTLTHMVEYYIGKRPLVVGNGIKTGLNIKYENPREVGSDRIINSVAAMKKYGGNLIVVDFGTATTFNVITEKGEFLGGAIAPGIKLSVDSLASNCVKLPKIELQMPKSVIGKNTITNMQSGIVYGYIGLLEKIIKQIKTETRFDNAKVIVTGGLSEVVVNHTDVVDVVDRRLSLNGLRIIYDMNKSEAAQ